MAELLCAGNVCSGPVLWGNWGVTTHNTEAFFKHFYASCERGEVCHVGYECVCWFHAYFYLIVRNRYNYDI